MCNMESDDLKARNENTTCRHRSLYNNTEDDHVIAFWSGESLHKIAPMLFVMLTTIVGNLVLIVSLTNRRTRRRKRVNVFIVNLAIADLTVAFITMTTELLEAVFKQWILGAFLCKLLLYLQVVTLSSTTFLLTGMSIDRYQVIVRPLKSLAQRPKIKAKVVMAWLSAFVFAIPQVFIFVQVEVFSETKQTYVHYCKSAGYSAEWQRKFYFTFLTFYILLLPAGIMTFCYSAIARVIWNRGEHNQDTALSTFVGNRVESPRMSMKTKVIMASRRKVVFMTLSVIIAYIVCLTPYFIISLIRIYSHYTLDLRNALTVSQIIFMLHSALNPILYGLFTLRTAHMSLCYSFVLCRKPGRKNHQRSIIKTPHLVSLRKRIFFRRRNNEETSVIIAHHAAKEESSFKLRHRQNGKYITTFNSNYRGFDTNLTPYKWTPRKVNGGQTNLDHKNYSVDSDTISSEI
ncbi:mesotocin receptor-like [Mercenaria mercenaria]|uniref:mesotocin receptor-like n=1 Tax=Mercenaria mercenaria TaxID=6596 RepID=UPI00234F67F5|nr:mesotocin receptor-like [Mercenaria mercenaria]